MPKKAAAAILALILTTGFSPSQRTDSNCLARTIYHEARGASQLDQRAVAHVVINRKESNNFPSTICGVVYDRGEFTWTRTNPNVREWKAWDRSKRLSDAILEGSSVDPTNGATYFWKTTVNPRWGRSYRVTLRTNAHVYAKPR